MTRTALIAGATGLVGQHLLTRLLADERYGAIKVLGRRALDRSSPRLGVIISDYSDLDVRSRELAADDVYCCLGTTMRTAGSREAFERVDYGMVVDVARAARAAGAQRFMLVSAAGASASSMAFYSRVKARAEAAVCQLGYAEVHIVRPSLLIGARSEHRPGEKLAQKAAPLMKLLLPGPLKKYQPIEADEVAHSMVELAWSHQPGAHIHHLPLQ